MKSLTRYALIILSVQLMPVKAQIGWEWAFAENSTLESQGESVFVDEDGNIYLTGYFGGEMHFGDQVLTAVNTHDFFVARLDKNAQLHWIQQGGGAGYNHGNAVVADSMGNTYVTGSLADKANAFLQKYDSLGNLVWNQDIGTGYHWENRGSLISTDGQDIYVGAGYGLMKYDATGTIRHSKSLTPSALSNVEQNLIVAATNSEIFVYDTDLSLLDQYPIPSGIEQVNSIALFQGDIYLTGRYNGSLSAGDVTLEGDQDMFVSRIDQTGSIDWINGAGGDSFDTGHSLVVTRGGQLYVAGRFRNTATFDQITIGRPGLFEEIFVAEYDTADGKLVDLIHAGGDGDYDVAYGMAATPENDLLVTGSLRDYVGVSFGDIMVNSPSGNIDFFLAKVSQPEIKSRLAGVVSKSDLPATSRIKLFRIDQDSIMELAGDKFTDGEGAYNFDIYHSGDYLIKACYATDEYINTYYRDAFLWNQGSFLQIVSDTLIDTLDIDLIELPQSVGSNSISGKITDNEDEPKRFVDMILTTADSQPFMYTRSDTTGTYVFTGVPQGSFEILVDTAGVNLVSWYSIDVSDLKSSVNAYTDYDFQFRDGMIYAANDINTPVHSQDADHIRFYPVPAGNSLHVDFTGAAYPWLKIEIMDIHGRRVLHQELTGNEQLNLEDLPGGVYILHIRTPDYTFISRKFLKL